VASQAQAVLQSTPPKQLDSAAHITVQRLVPQPTGQLQAIFAAHRTVQRAALRH
jgi:hypothetical protein